MADNKLVGQNYTTPDLVAKVTGAAKYAEDYRVEGMLFAKLLCSPMPHARVTRLDTSRALAMEGVKAILTADDMPGAAAGATLGEGVQATPLTERGLTNEPFYHGEPILAVAAIDELTGSPVRPPVWGPATYVLKGAGRLALDDAEREFLGERAARFPALG